MRPGDVVCRWLSSAFARGCTASLLFFTALSAEAAPHKWRVDDPALARTLLSQGATLVGDYGSYKVIQTEGAPGNAVGGRIQSFDRLDAIRLNARTLNTAAPEIRSLRKPEGTFPGKRLHLVHFTGPIRPEWIEHLSDTGARVVTYLPENTYLVYADSPTLARLQEWAAKDGAVQWEGAYAPGYKIALGARRAPAGAGTPLVAIQLVEDASANATTLEKIRSISSEPTHENRALEYLNVIAAVPQGRLDEIASQPDVVSIQPFSMPKRRDERQDQIMAGQLTGSAPSGPGYLAWLAGKRFAQEQFDTSGFVVDLSDSGIDNGTLTPGHFGLYPLGNPLKRSRIAYSRLEGTPNAGSTLQGCDGHGTINAHIIAGYDDLAGFPFTDDGGFSYGLGVCPFARVGASVIFDPDNFTFPDFRVLHQQAYANGARISSNSWGFTNGAAYDQQAQLFDALVRDVGGNGGKQAMVMVFVSGNEGPDAETINSPGSAKNVITVGASENVRSLIPAKGGLDGSGQDGCGVPDTLADDANSMTDFSSRGPCVDGRMKPDVVAPGTHVTGGVAQAGRATFPTNSTGRSVNCFSATAVCGLPGADFADFFFPLNQEFYTVSTGSSHAAPAVAGACALVRQHFLNSNLLPPSPAMTKAYLMNSARYLTGFDANDDLWSSGQGMGEVDLDSAFDGAPRILRDQVDVLTSSGQARTFTGVVSDTSKPFRVTLAWTDAPGSPAARFALVNDLDLQVAIGGNLYRGNVFSGSQSVVGGTADSLNNVESVLLPAGVSGPFTVTVVAANIAADAIVRGGGHPRQDFALVIDNATPTSVPFAPIAATYRGLFYQSIGVRFMASGAVVLTTTAAGGYSGTVQMGSHRYSFAGKLDASGIGSNTIPRLGTNALSVVFQVDANDYNLITGSVGDTTWTADLHAERVAIGASNHTVLAGRYTMRLLGPSNGDPGTPQGDGYGAVTVGAGGTITLNGSLPDGTPLMLLAPLAGQGSWPLYASLYNGRGQVLGWLTFTNTQDLGGPVNWIKLPIPASAIYKSGFSTNLTALGGAYHPPLPLSAPMLGFTNGVVTLSGANLPTTLVNNIRIKTNNVVVDTTLTNKLTMTFNAANGFFSGSAVNPATGTILRYKGAMLQNSDTGSGFFISGSLTGRATVGP